MHVAHNIEQDIARWEKLAEIVKLYVQTQLIATFSATQSVSIVPFSGPHPGYTFPRLY
jgi:hypothetical protein